MTIGTKEDTTMIPLSIEQIEIYISKDRQSILASLFECPKGARHWDVFKISNLSDSLISTHDCEHFSVVRLVE
jgi:hypothetical protein